MIGLDTNVLVRYITQDDPRQTPKANKVVDALSAEVPGFVSTVVLVELVWVLDGCYRYSREQLSHTLGLLLQTKELVIERAADVSRALRVFAAGGADFADCLIERLGASAGCKRTLTFDVGAAKAAGMQLIV